MAYWNIEYRGEGLRLRVEDFNGGRCAIQIKAPTREAAIGKFIASLMVREFTPAAREEPE